jgi:hypothetical protein
MPTKSSKNILHSIRHRINVGILRGFASWLSSHCDDCSITHRNHCSTSSLLAPLLPLGQMLTESCEVHFLMQASNGAVLVHDHELFDASCLPFALRWLLAYLVAEILLGKCTVSLESLSASQ